MSHHIDFCMHDGQKSSENRSICRKKYCFCVKEQEIKEKESHISKKEPVTCILSGKFCDNRVLFVSLYLFLGKKGVLRYFIQNCLDSLQIGVYFQLG